MISLSTVYLPLLILAFHLGEINALIYSCNEFKHHWKFVSLNIVSKFEYDYSQLAQSEFTSKSEYNFFCVIPQEDVSFAK